MELNFVDMMSGNNSFSICLVEPSYHDLVIPYFALPHTLRSEIESRGTIEVIYQLTIYIAPNVGRSKLSALGQDRQSLQIG
jgi:hypothetical protein